jgi:hypothetical protein
MGAELFHAEGRTDMTNLIVVFRNFANVPKNLGLPLCLYQRSSLIWDDDTGWWYVTAIVTVFLLCIVLFIILILYCVWLRCTVCYLN